MKKVSSETFFFRQHYDLLGQMMWLGHTMINKVFCKPSDMVLLKDFCARRANIYFNEDRSLLPPDWKRFDIINLTPGFSGQ